jgi:predicted esterase
MKNYLYIISLMCISFLTAQNDFQTGKVLDSISVDTNSDESYAIYLPEQFNPNILNAIVFIFDPVGRGRNGIRPFIEASEQYNYILICSNDARNGPYEKNFELANSLFNSVFSKFNIDPKQIYVAGFSGGSRFSTAIAVLTEQMRGVIACGAGFPDNLSYAPSAPVFLYAGIVGDRDMNYNEMRNNRLFLDKLGFTNALFVFDGNHRWPPSESILEVFDWIQILAFKEGVRPINELQTESIFNKMYRNAMLTSDLVQKEAMLDRISHGFKTLMNTDSIAKQNFELRNSKQFASAKSDLEKIFKKEDQLIDKFIPRFYKDYKNPSKADLNWWDKELRKLIKVAKINKAHSNMIDRFTYKLLELVYTRSNPSYFTVSEDQQHFCNEILKMLKKKYDLIYIY